MMLSLADPESCDSTQQVIHSKILIKLKILIDSNRSSTEPVLSLMILFAYVGLEEY